MIRQWTVLFTVWCHRWNWLKWHLWCIKIYHVLIYRYQRKSWYWSIFSHKNQYFGWTTILIFTAAVSSHLISPHPPLSRCRTAHLAYCEVGLRPIVRRPRPIIGPILRCLTKAAPSLYMSVVWLLGFFLFKCVFIGLFLFLDITNLTVNCLHSHFSP